MVGFMIVLKYLVVFASMALASEGGAQSSGPSNLLVVGMIFFGLLSFVPWLLLKKYPNLFFKLPDDHSKKEPDSNKKAPE
jgi:hypothetical protein